MVLDALVLIVELVTPVRALAVGLVTPVCPASGVTLRSSLKYACTSVSDTGFGSVTGGGRGGGVAWDDGNDWSSTELNPITGGGRGGGVVWDSGMSWDGGVPVASPSKGVDSEWEREGLAEGEGDWKGDRGREGGGGEGELDGNRTVAGCTVVG